MMGIFSKGEFIDKKSKGIFGKKVLK